MRETEPIQISTTEQMHYHIHKQNAEHLKTIKFTTYVSTFLQAASFLTSWYGMNFIMPELSYANAYFIFVATLLILFFICIVAFLFKWYKEQS